MQTYSNNLDPLSGQLLGSIAFHTPGDSSDGPVILQLGIVQESADDGAALLASGAKDGDDLLRGHCEWSCW